MTDRHLFDDHTTLVVAGLKGVVQQHPNLSLIPALKVTFDAGYDRSKVSTISGGGSGHEPFSAGFVGRAFLTASASGDVFASPSARQVYGAIKSVASDEGVILIITNYTSCSRDVLLRCLLGGGHWRVSADTAVGLSFASLYCAILQNQDNLHFGLACQQARADGMKNVEMVPVGDDVSVGRATGSLVGRRALAGVMLVCKLVGAASEESWKFDRCLDLTRATADNLVSCAALLDHASVPGRSEFGKIPDGTIEIGVGLHNEPGFFVIPEQPSPEEFIKRMLKLLLDQTDKDRAYVRFDEEDQVVLLLNNQGGMSTLEMNAAVGETLRQLEMDWQLKPVRVLQGAFVTTLNAPGFSISLLNVSRTAKAVSSSAEKLLALLDAPHGALSWPGGSPMAFADAKLAKRTFQERLLDPPSTEVELTASGPAVTLKTNPNALAAALRSGAEAARDAEPDLTRWDTVVGDGDCGETVMLGAQAVLKAVDGGFCSSGDIIKTLRDLTTIIDDSCGGTLGAIISIYLASLTTEARLAAHERGEKSDGFPWGEVCSKALATLQRSTAARKGMRTVMDAIIPLVEELVSSGDFAMAVAACKRGAEATQSMKAKLGRATYVGDKKDLPPDPGAMAFATAMEGYLRGLRGASETGE